MGSQWGDRGMKILNCQSFLLFCPQWELCGENMGMGKMLRKYVGKPEVLPSFLPSFPPSALHDRDCKVGPGLGESCLLDTGYKFAQLRAMNQSWFFDQSGSYVGKMWAWAKF